MNRASPLLPWIVHRLVFLAVDELVALRADSGSLVEASRRAATAEGWRTLNSIPQGSVVGIYRNTLIAMAPVGMQWALLHRVRSFDDLDSLVEDLWRQRQRCDFCNGPAELAMLRAGGVRLVLCVRCHANHLEDAVAAAP